MTMARPYLSSAIAQDDKVEALLVERRTYGVASLEKKELYGRCGYCING